MLNVVAFHNLNLEELDSVSEIGGSGGGGGGGVGGRHSHSSNGGGSYLPSIFNQPTSAVSASTVQQLQQQPAFWNPVVTFPPTSGLSQQPGPVFSPYPMPMMYPPVSQPPAGYLNPDDGRIHPSSGGIVDPPGCVNFFHLPPLLQFSIQ